MRALTNYLPLSNNGKLSYICISYSSPTSMKIIPNKEKYGILGPDPLQRCSVWALVDQTSIDGSDQEATFPQSQNSVNPVHASSSDSSELSVIIDSLDEEFRARSNQKHIVVHEDFAAVQPSSSKQDVFLPKQDSKKMWQTFVKDSPAHHISCKSEDSESLMELNLPKTEKLPILPTTGRIYSFDTPKRPTIPRRLSSLSHLCRAVTQIQEATPPKIEPKLSPQPKEFNLDAPVTPKSRQSEEAPVNVETLSPPQKRRKVSKRHEPDYLECKIALTRIKERRPYNIAKNPEPNPFFCQATQQLSTPDVMKYFMSPLDKRLCNIARKRYLRASLDELQNSTTDYIFKRSDLFSTKELYTFQWVRIQKSPDTGLPALHTQCALCIYCKRIQFFNIQLSHFRNHMLLCHGVFANGYLTPDPLKAGIYRLPNQFNHRVHVLVESEVKCVACPVCYHLFEIDLWVSDPENSKLSAYLRHFQEFHRIKMPGLQYFDRSFKG